LLIDSDNGSSQSSSLDLDLDLDLESDDGYLKLSEHDLSELTTSGDDEIEDTSYKTNSKDARKLSRPNKLIGGPRRVDACTSRRQMRQLTSSTGNRRTPTSLMVSKKLIGMKCPYL